MTRPTPSAMLNAPQQEMAVWPGDAAGDPTLASLMDVTVPMSIELGRTQISIDERAKLGRGSVVQLGRRAGEPIDLYVAGRLFAQGEVVVLGDQFGVRITKILNRLTMTEGNA